MLLECASIQIQNVYKHLLTNYLLQLTPENGLFHLVCSNCAHEVSRWYIFKQQVIQSFEIGHYILDRSARSVTANNEPALSNLRRHKRTPEQLLCKVCNKQCSSTN